MAKTETWWKPCQCISKPLNNEVHVRTMSTSCNEGMRNLYTHDYTRRYDFPGHPFIISYIICCGTPSIVEIIHMPLNDHVM